MTTHGRFLWGGLGGLAPILATFLILEADIIGRYLSEMGRGGSLLTIVGYAVRVVGLFVVGGLWATLHKSERDPKKLFQLGIVAPAMITGMISASNVNAGDGDIQTASFEVRPLVAAEASTAGVAATTESMTSPRSLMANRDEPEPAPEQPPEPPPIKSFIRGLLGRP